MNRFHTYKSVCHFIVAYRLLEEEQGYEPWADESFSLQDPEHIKRFLIIAYALRGEFLSLRTNNAKEKFLFPEEILVPLPSWINDESIEALSTPLEKQAQTG